jgi:hypothetical protein
VPLGSLALGLALLTAGETWALAAVGSGGTGDEEVPLRDILNAMSRTGVPLIYSTETVPAELKAHPPPPRLPLKKRLKSLLTTFGLEARQLPNGGFVIVRATPILGQLAVTVTLDRLGRIEALPGASVSLVGDHRRAVSDASGQVQFADLPPGHYQLEARYDGLKTVHRSIQLSGSGGTAQLELRLAWTLALLEEVRIDGMRVEDAGAALGRVITRETLESNPTTSGDAARALQLLPGGAVAGYSAKSHVRGGRDDEALFRYDGVTLTDPYHLEALQSLNSALDPAVIDSARTWTGVAPMQLAGSIGAVVDLKPRAVMAPMVDARVSNRDVNLVAGTPFAGDLGTLLASARATNEYSPARWLEPGSLTPDFRDYLLRTTWNAGPRTRLAAGLLAIDDKRDTLTSEAAPFDQRARLVSHERYGWLRWWQAFTPALQSETLLSTERSNGQALGRVVVPDVQRGFLTRKDQISALTIREELAFRATAKWSWILGAQRTEATVDEVLVSRVTFQPPFVPGLQPLAQWSTNDTVAIRSVASSWYGAIQWQRGEQTVVDLGARRDERQFSALAAADAYWSASASVTQQLASSSILRFGWGRATQASVLELVQGADGVLHPPSARLLTQVDVGLDQVLDPHWLLKINVYDKRERSPYTGSENVFTPFALLPEIGLGAQTVNSTRARMRGIETQIESDPRLPLSGWLSYARAQADDRIAGQWVPRSWDQPNAAQIGARWLQGPWQLTGLFSWHTGWPYTPLQVSSTVWTDPSAVSVGLGSRNSVRMASSASLDIRISWDHPVGQGIVQVALEMNNVTNSKTVCCHSYSVTEKPDGSSQFLDTPGYWLGFAPKLIFRWRL